MLITIARVAPGRARPAPVTQAGASAVDEAVLANLAADLGAAHIGEVSRLFLDNAKLEVEVVRTCLDSGDLVGAADAAHRLKSASGFLGATGLISLCAAVESGAPPAGAGGLLAAELARTGAELDNLVKRMPEAP